MDTQKKETYRAIDPIPEEQPCDYAALVRAMNEIRSDANRMVEGKKRITRELAARWTAIHRNVQTLSEGNPRLLADFRAYLTELSATYEGSVRAATLLNAVRARAGLNPEEASYTAAANLMLRLLLQQTLRDDPNYLSERLKDYLGAAPTGGYPRGENC